MRIRLTIAIMALAVSVDADAQSPARRKITFFAYDGAAASHVQEVATQVRWKVTRSARPVDLSYLEDAVAQQRLPPASDRLTFWRDSQSLLLAGGLVIREKAGDEFRNEIFLGEYGRRLPDALFINFLFAPKKFASTKDALSAATLYAVAMERVKRSDLSQHTRDLLAKALTLITDVENRGDGGDDVTRLRTVIAVEWSKLQ